MSYADVETILRDWLAARVTTGVDVIVEPTDGLPRQLALTVPLIAVSHVDGSDPFLGISDLIIDIDSYASTYDTARALAQQTHLWVRRDLPGHSVAGTTVSRTFTQVLPRKLPWDATNVIKVGGVYELRAKTRIGSPSP